MVNHQEVFSECIKKQFAYLANDFGFSLVEDQYHQSAATCVVAFQNQFCYVKFAWALRGDRLDFRICRVLSDGTPAPYKDYGTDEFLLFALVKYYEPQTDLDTLTAMNYYNPDLQMLDEKVSANAKVLRKYGQEILKGNEWFDWIKKEIISNPK
jgi:hypothetical protein